MAVSVPSPMQARLREIERGLIEHSIPEAQRQLAEEERCLHQLMPSGRRFMPERQTEWMAMTRDRLMDERRRLLACRWLLDHPWRRLRLEYDKRLGKGKDTVPSFIEIVDEDTLRCEPALSEPFLAKTEHIYFLVDLIAIECTPHVES